MTRNMGRELRVSKGGSGLSAAARVVREEKYLLDLSVRRSLVTLSISVEWIRLKPS